MYDNFFTTYEITEPPPIQRRTYSRDIKNDIDKRNINLNDYPMVVTVDNPDLSETPSELEAQNPFVFQTEQLPKYNESVLNTSTVSSTSSTGKETSNKVSQTFSSPSDFVSTLNSVYKKVLQKRGLNPNFSAILTALDALETGWGKSVKGNFNYGNITAGKGEAWHILTGKRKWRDFKSIEDYVNEKINFLSRSRYKFFETFTPSSNVTIAMLTLANRGYDPGNPAYGRAVYNTYNTLKKYLS